MRKSKLGIGMILILFVSAGMAPKVFCEPVGVGEHAQVRDLVKFGTGSGRTGFTIRVHFQAPRIGKAFKNLPFSYSCVS